MTFEWDEAKCATNLRARGFDFEFASLAFDGPTLEAEDKRRDYGERRWIAIGRADQVHLPVVYTDRQAARGEVVRRIISARRSTRAERRIYGQAVEQE